jgi:chondroitin AC lyase
MCMRLFIIICLLSTLSPAQAQVDTVLNRYSEYLFRTSQPPKEGMVRQWMDSLDAQGQWPDVSYHDREPADWKVARHLKRIQELSMAWANPQSAYHHNQELLQKINLALDHWLAKRYENSNWWHNQIGVPRYMRDIIILLRHDLTPERFRQSLEVLSQLRVQGKGAGANLMWSADLGLHYGAMAGDEALVNRCRALMVNEISISDGEGIQADNSFHQHSKRLQMYQYGKAFLWETARVAWQLRGTPLAFPEEKVDIMTNFVLEGWQWMARGINTVPGTMDRSSSRVGELRSPDLRPLIPFMMELQPAKAAAFRTMMAIQNGDETLEGYRYYPYSDFSAFHRPGFSFLLKTISTRTLTTESFNGENLKGRLLNSGDAYLIRNGQEYFNLMPVWDWTALPGVTTFKNAYKIEQRAFAGGVSNGVSGLAAMDYGLADETKQQSFSAHKFWACHKDAVVCLISGTVGGNLAGDIYTAMDQCRWQGDVTVNKPGNTLAPGAHKLNNVKWIHHAGFAYIPVPFYKASVALRLEKVTGNWKTINVSQLDKTISERIFMPVLNHEESLQEQSAGYVLAYCPTPKQAAKLADKPNWRVLRNSKDCQAVLFDDGTLMASFFNAHKLSYQAFDLEADRPCLILISNNKMYVSDPLHKGGAVRVHWKNTVRNIDLPADGATVEAGVVETPLSR